MAKETKDFVMKNDASTADDAGKQKSSSNQGDQCREKTKQEFALPQINFATFILSLNSSALVQLGIIEDPVNGKKSKNFALAKQTIDILGMLEQKTRGNLTEDEEQILKNILYELRMRYVQEKC